MPSIKTIELIFSKTETRQGRGLALPTTSFPYIRCVRAHVGGDPSSAAKGVTSGIGFDYPWRGCGASPLIISVNYRLFAGYLRSVSGDRSIRPSINPSIYRSPTRPLFRPYHRVSVLQRVCRSQSVKSSGQALLGSRLRGVRPKYPEVPLLVDWVTTSRKQHLPPNLYTILVKICHLLRLIIQVGDYIDTLGSAA